MTAETKPEALQEPLFSSPTIGSSPEGDFDLDPPLPVQPVKRKGGRKPIYATSEERKQRNRQAQAAFRERRTEYIKHLEVTIKQHEDAVQSLQQEQYDAATECSRLRYKTSILERILMEKGFDVEAELRSKAVSPISRPEDLSTMPGNPHGWQQPGPGQSNPSKVRPSDTSLKGRPGLEMTEAQLAHLSFNNNPSRGFQKQNSRIQHQPPPLETGFPGDDNDDDRFRGLADPVQSSRQSWPQGGLASRTGQNHPVSISLDLGISPTFSPDFPSPQGYPQPALFNGSNRRSFVAQSPTTSLGKLTPFFSSPPIQ